MMLYQSQGDKDVMKAEMQLRRVEKKDSILSTTSAAITFNGDENDDDTYDTGKAGCNASQHANDDDARHFEPYRSSAADSGSEF